MTQAFNPEIVASIERLAETGSNYRIYEMDGLYDETLGFLVLADDGTVARLSKTEMFGEFRARRDAGEAPLSTKMRNHHMKQQDDEATAILYRRMMSRKADPALYELLLKKRDGSWRVFGETVAPWPDLADARGFLPPRRGGTGDAFS